MLGYSDCVTRLNNDGVIKFVNIHYLTEPNLSFFSERALINNDSSFCSLILSAIDLQCHVFPFEKLLLNVFFCKRHFWWHQIWRHLHVKMLQYWAKFSNGLVHWSIGIIHAKNYQTVSKFVKVMGRIRWPLFPIHSVHLHWIVFLYIMYVHVIYIYTEVQYSTQYV